MTEKDFVLSSCLAKGTKHKQNVFEESCVHFSANAQQEATVSTRLPALLAAQVEVVSEGKGSAVHVLHAGGGEDCSVLPDTE